MFRLIHAQKNSGSLLINDIDDGLANKPRRRSNAGHPDGSPPVGYANVLKQPAYVPRRKPGEPAIAGYIDLQETQAVLLSAGGGTIAGFRDNGYLTVVSLIEDDLTPATLTSATLAGDVTLAGTDFESVEPDVSEVIFEGPGAVVLSRDDIETAGGTFSDVSIVVPAALIAGVTAALTTARVKANGKVTALVTVA
jgi:hypothetical protein